MYQIYGARGWEECSYEIALLYAEWGYQTRYIQR